MLPRAQSHTPPGGAVSAAASQTPPVTDRERLLSRYRELVLAELPRRGRAEGWVVTADHCFGRLVLDHAVQCRWDDVLDRRRSPAFGQLDDAQLAAAVALAGQIAVEGDPLLRRLDAQSLAWRGKRSGRSRGRPA